MDSGRKTILATLQYVGAAILLVFLCYCLRFNVDLTDEGFYLYFYRWGSEVASFNFYHLLVSPLGRIFDHQLLFYRYLSVVALSIVPLLFIGKDKKFFLLGLCFSLFYFNQLGTFSYNTFSLISLCAILSMLLKWKESDRKFLLSGLTGFFVFLVFSARLAPAFVILLFVCTYYFSSGREWWKYAILTALNFLLPIAAMLIFWKEGWQDTFANFESIRMSSHQGIVEKYIAHGTEYLLKSVFVPVVILLAGKNFLKNRTHFLHMGYLLWITVNNFFLKDSPTSFGYYFTGYLLAFSIITIWNERKKIIDERHKFIVFPLAFYFLSSLGTNNNIFKASTYNLILLFPLVLYFLRQQKGKIIYAAVAVAFTVSSVGLYRHQFLKTYRSLSRDAQIRVPSKYPVLSGILIDENYEKKLVLIEEELRQRGAVPNRDLIVAYPNMPGVLSVLGFRALGSPWNNPSYPNSWMTSCAQIKNDRWKGGRTFLILSGDLPVGLHACLSERALFETIAVEKFR